MATPHEQREAGEAPPPDRPAPPADERPPPDAAPAPEKPAPPPDEGPPPDEPVPPLAEARRSVAAARERLAAATALLASNDPDAPQRAHEEAAQTATLVARALWFLRRAEREGTGGA